MEDAVEWGLAHRDLSKVTSLGVDEIAWHRGHTYLTLVFFSVALGTSRGPTKVQGAGAGMDRA